MFVSRDLFVSVFVAALLFSAPLFAENTEPDSKTQKTPKQFFIKDEEENVPVTSIVIKKGDHPFVKLAATELANYLFPEQDKSKSIKEEDNITFTKGVIFVGSASVESGLVTNKALKKLGDGGYFITASQGATAVSGESPVAVIDGAMALLRRFGFIFYYRKDPPLLPKENTVILDSFTESRTPAFSLRLGPAAPARYWLTGFQPMQVMGNPRELGIDTPIVHTADMLVNYEKYHKEHPEYFALGSDGKRLHRRPGKPMPIHLCMSNPEVVDVAAENLCKWIDKQSDRKYFFVSPGDFSDWCCCENCKKLDADPMKNTTDRSLYFTNAVARKVRDKYPDKIIMFLSYRESSYAPSREKLESNVQVMFCLYPPFFNSQSTFRSNGNKDGVKELDLWLKKFPGKVHIFDYPRSYASNIEVFGSFYACVEKIKYFAAHKVPGIYYCSTANDFQALWEYVMMKLMWNPKENVEQLVDQFMGFYYGPAASYMRQYHNLIYSEIRRRRIQQYCETRNIGLVTKDFASKGYELFDKACAAVEGNQKYLDRILPEKRRLLFCDVDEHNLYNGEADDNLEEYALKLAEFIGSVRKHKLPYFDREYKTAKWFERTAGLKVQKEWYKDPVIDELLANPLKTLQEKSTLLNGFDFKQEKTDYGWNIPLQSILGGKGPKHYDYKCPARTAVWVQMQSSPFSKMRTYLTLAKEDIQPLEMVVEAQISSQKPTIAVLINGHDAFKGKASGAVANWKETRLSIPASMFKPGKNKIEIVNLTEKRLVKGSYFSSWYMISKLEFHKKK